MLFTVIYGGKKKLIKVDGADYTSLMTQVRKKFSISDKDLTLQNDTGVEVDEDVFTDLLEERSHDILWRVVDKDSECSVLDSSCSSQTDTLSVSSETDDSAGPSSKRPCFDGVFEAKQFVRDILEEKAGGPAVLSEYKEHGKLTDSTRRHLVNIVVAHITDKEGRVPSKETKTRCALGIVTLFPSMKDPYSRTGYEHFYDPKSNQGYISWRLKTVSRQSKHHGGHHSKKDARSSGTSDSEGSGGPTAHRETCNHLEQQLEGDQCKEAISFMNHCVEKDLIFEKMKATFKHRQLLIHDAAKSNTVLSVFPRFLDTKGLILQDFDIQFGTETASRLLEQWDSLKSKIIAEARTLTSTLHLNSLLSDAQGNRQDEDSDWQVWDSDMSSILLLANLLPPSAGGRNKSTKISIREAMNHIVQFHKACRSLTEHINKTEGVQPHLLAVGSAKNIIHDFYIVLDGKLLPCQAKSSLAAFDELFKAYFVFSVSYPHCLRAMYTFIQTTIYKIDLGTYRETPRVKDLRAKLLN
ncbi:uncharacterized protein adgra1a isoform X2 [Triplophysa rosa]|uniref:uncharacterized protein adgra1a isoform X2 n=1 Tax=Triplophysa rosa TaxID=992332 RepID=UPI002545DD68|nr:uncharacterized protein adgra1a isoform X2 [Triplophysa rosa]XP_057214465.1 uncharacterized protein adgra1a isoform X2 [Triplophysa rosa]